MEIIEADLTFVGDELREGVQIGVENGRIAGVGRLGQASRRLRNAALLPGLVSAHSHAFQIGLRGEGERYPAGKGSFWTWREAMYDLVAALDEDEFFSLTRDAFSEMRSAGFTAVGEFHYFHHSKTGNDFAFDRTLIAAARAAGIRLVLLSAYYATGGIGQPLGGAQARFATPSPEDYWRSVDRLEETDTVTVGAVVHSIRAAPIDDLVAVRSEARRRGMVFHMHLEEQPAEIESALEAYGARPAEIVLRHGLVDSRFTAVHCTHTTPADLDELVTAGGHICVCPLTEANLGDGIPDLSAALTPPDSICIGTDSNVRLSGVEELRWLEYGQRLKTVSRGIFAGDDGRLGPRLLHAGTAAGAASLGLPTGTIRAGAHADFVALDLDSPSLRRTTEATLLAAWLTSSGNEAIFGTCVGGSWRLHGERDPAD